MKSLHKVVLFCIMATAGAATYYYFKSRSMSVRIDDNSAAIEVQGGKIETLEVRVDGHQMKIGEQGKEIAIHWEKIATQSDRIQKTHARSEALSVRIGELEQNAAQDKDALAKLRKELAVLKDDYDRRMAESEKQLEEALQRDEEHDARLRAIEKSLGIDRPEP